MGITKLNSIFGALFVPTWLHFAFQNPPKTPQKPTPRRIKILIDFSIASFPFWAPLREPRISRIFPDTAPRATQKRMDPLSATKSTPGTPTRPPECSTGASRDTFRQPKKAQGTPKKHQRTRVKLVGPAECAERSAAQRGRRARPLDQGALVLASSLLRQIRILENSGS